MSNPLPTLINYVIKSCDYFLPEQLRANSDQLFRGRLLVALVLANQCLLIFESVYIALVNSLPRLALQVTFCTTGGLTLALAGLLFYLRSTGALVRCGKIVVAVVFIAVQIGIIVSGGPLASPTTDLIPIPALLAFCFSGRQLGLFWVVTSIIVYCLLSAAQLSGINFPNVGGETTPLIDHAITWSIAFLSTIGIMLAYEIIKKRLQQERNKQRANYEYLATHDALTGIANRSKFIDELSLAIDRSSRYEHLVALVYIDLDGFKPVNDQLGHEAGDSVLQTIALRITKAVRNIDTVARVGGDEFAIILEKIHSINEALIVAEKLRLCIAQPIDNLTQFPISGSMGIAIAPLHSREADVLLNQADQAMYCAKRNKNSVVLFDATTQ